jgi:hypothetical protein
MGLDDHNDNRVNLTATGLRRDVTAGHIPPEGYLDASQVVDAVNRRRGIEVDWRDAGTVAQDAGEAGLAAAPAADDRDPFHRH